MAGKAGRSGRRAAPDVISFTTTEAPAVSWPRPDFALPVSRDVWDELLPQLIELGRVADTDRLAFTKLCEIEALYQMTYAAAANDPTDPSIRTALVSYTTTLDRLYRNFALTPCDRAKVKNANRNKLITIEARKRG